jgi:hypothetical protein
MSRWIPGVALVSVVACGTLAGLVFEPGAGAARSVVITKALPMPQDAKSDVDLSSVSCVGTHFCVAVGAFRPNGSTDSDQDERQAILRFNGQRWSSMKPPSAGEAELDGVDCLTRSMCIAVGSTTDALGESSPLINQMEGNSWSVVSSPSPNYYSENSSQLQAVSCLAVNRCTAVGTDKGVGYGRGLSPSTGIVEQQTEGGWTLAPVAPLVPKTEPPYLGGAVVPTNAYDPSALVTISCTPVLCVSGGQGQTFLERTPGIWTPITNSPPTTNGISCPASQTCTGVGSGGSGLPDNVAISTTTSIVKLSGSGWVRTNSPNTKSPSNSLDSVACHRAGSCVAVGEFEGPPVGEPQSKGQGGSVVAVESNGSWHLTTVPNTSGSKADLRLASVSCPTAHLCVAVGQSVVDPERVPSGPIASYSVLIRY